MNITGPEGRFYALRPSCFRRGHRTSASWRIRPPPWRLHAFGKAVAPPHPSKGLIRLLIGPMIGSRRIGNMGGIGGIRGGFEELFEGVQSVCSADGGKAELAERLSKGACTASTSSSL